MQAVGLLAKDDFLTNFNVSIDASDVVNYIVALKRVWHEEKWTNQYGYFGNKIYFANKFGVEMAEIITPWGFCYSFNVIDSNKLFHLDRLVLIVKSRQDF